jgi:hypothetical protein
MAVQRLSESLLELAGRHVRREIEEGPGRRGDGDSLDPGDFVSLQGVAVDADSGAAADVSPRNRDVHRTGLGWVAEQVPEGRGAVVTQDGTRSTRQHRSHLPGQRRHDRADAVDASEDGSESPRIHPAVDGSPVESEL